MFTYFIQLTKQNDFKIGVWKQNHPPYSHGALIYSFPKRRGVGQNFYVLVGKMNDRIEMILIVRTLKLLRTNILQEIHRASKHSCFIAEI